MVSVTFYGAAGGVTGSKHLVETDNHRVLLDCGTFQGLPDVRERNRSFPFGPDTIDAVVLSHAHLDHCGMLPLLVKRGFMGKIYATGATCDVARYMLEDSAGIEEQDARYRAKHKIGAPDEREPLFTRDDVQRAVNRFVDVPYTRDSNDWHDIMPGVRLKMYDAGHILGSAAPVLAIDEGDTTKHIGFSGDLGPQDVPLLHNPTVPQEELDMLLLESTYGKRSHAPLDTAIDRIVRAVNRVVRSGGKIIVPAFSLGRTQMFVYIIHKLVDEGRIPPFPIYVDSPLATDITHVYRSHREDYDIESEQDFEGKEHTPLSFGNLTYTQSAEESKRLNVTEGPFMVISASGMMTAGRVVHHLRHSIQDSKNAIFITGYQAEGTLGRRLLEGAKRVELYGDMFSVRAQLYLFNEFSAHADIDELTSYALNIPRISTIALVHGEGSNAYALRERLMHENKSWDVRRPHEGDVLHC